MSDAAPRVGETFEEGQTRPAQLGELYKRHWGELVRFVHRTYGSGPPEPEDVAQIAFGQYAALAEPDQVENPKAFLYQSARNYIVDQRRRTHVRNRFANGPDAERIVDSAHGIDAERVLQAKQRLKIVGRTIEDMPARQREFFILNRIEGLTFAEIARRASVSEAVVRKYVLRAAIECGRAIRAAEGEDRQVADVNAGDSV